MRLIVHTLPQAIAALTAAVEAGTPVTLLSPPNAAQSQGVGYVLAMMQAARAAVPGAQCEAVVDCGEAPGLALGALRMGAEAVGLSAPPEVLAKLADIAGQRGVRLVAAEDAFDLSTVHDPLAAARGILGLK